MLGDIDGGKLNKFLAAPCQPGVRRLGVSVPPREQQREAHNHTARADGLHFLGALPSPLIGSSSGVVITRIDCAACSCLDRFSKFIRQPCIREQA